MPKSISAARKWNVSDEYWSGLSPAHRALYDVVRPRRQACYEVDVALSQIKSFLANVEADAVSAGGKLDLTPDFQRGHVWTDSQRERYVEAFIRGSTTGRILFNCPGWQSGGEGDIAPQTFQCIDGLQRLTTLQRFMNDEVQVFDGMRASDLRGSPFDPRRLRIQVAVFEFRTRVEMLQFYLDLNAGGTVHDPAELARVRELLRVAQTEAAAAIQRSDRHSPDRATQ